MSAAAASFDFMMAPLERSSLRSLRSSIVGRARGTVLELGAGTGVNLQYYNPATVNYLHITDLSVWRDRIIRKWKGGRSNGIPIRIDSADAENLPFGDGEFDSVVFTLLFCSVKDPHRGLREIHRVLKPGGIALFIEHVLPQSALARPMKAITPAWSRMAGNCHLDRDTVSAMRHAGFHVQVTHSAAYGIFVAGTAERAPEGS